METPFVKHLVNTFQSCKETLSVFSQVMEDWVRMFIPPCTAFMIEGLGEAAMRTQPDLSLEYWGQPDNATVMALMHLAHTSKNRVIRPWKLLLAVPFCMFFHQQSDLCQFCSILKRFLPFHFPVSDTPSILVQ